MAYKKGDKVKYYDSCKLFHNLPDVPYKQTQQMNTTMQQYLRAHISYSYLRDDWDAWLHLALETTSMSTIFANRDQYPILQFDMGA